MQESRGRRMKWCVSVDRIMAANDVSVLAPGTCEKCYLAWRSGHRRALMEATHGQIQETFSRGLEKRSVWEQEAAKESPLGSNHSLIAYKGECKLGKMTSFL